MKTRAKVGLVLGLILVLVFVVTTLYSGFSELSAKPADPDRAKRGEVIEYRVIYAKEVLEIKHMLFGIIPTYSEHFYVTLDEDGINRLAIRADKEWFSDNFSEDGVAKAPVLVSGLIKSSSGKKGLNLSGVNAKLGDMGHIEDGQYADASYISEASLKILSGVLLITAVITCTIMLIMLEKGIIRKGGMGVNVMAIAVIIQTLGFIIIRFAI